MAVTEDHISGLILKLQTEKTMPQSKTNLSSQYRDFS